MVGGKYMATNQLDRPGMTAKEKTEAKAALTLAGRYQWWKKLMKEGKTKRAMEYAGTYNLDVSEFLIPLATVATEPAVSVPEPLPTMVEAVAIEAVPEPVPAGHLVAEDLKEGDKLNGWPVKCVAEVYRYPVNKNMVVIQLDDGRQARLWNDFGGRRWALKSKVKVKLVEANPEDAIYEGDFDDGKAYA